MPPLLHGRHGSAGTTEVSSVAKRTTEAGSGSNAPTFLAGVQQDPGAAEAEGGGAKGSAEGAQRQRCRRETGGGRRGGGWSCSGAGDGWACSDAGKEGRDRRRTQACSVGRIVGRGREAGAGRSWGRRGVAGAGGGGAWPEPGEGRAADAVRKSDAAVDQMKRESWGKCGGAIFWEIAL